MEYCIYLRKSRADIEAEAIGEGETLARHEKILIDFSKRQNLYVTSIYREIVSGETISARPVMQQLLTEVEQGMWSGVLVMELERLARGDTIDQGIVAQAFKFSDTLIITPNKTYNPNNEFDEEYFEFGLFMSRREYKTINRRLQRGRLLSVSEGNYVGSLPPYGYDKVKLTNRKGYSLKANEQAQTVRIIFDMFVNQHQGTSKIASKLNLIRIPPQRGDTWTAMTIRDMLSNPVYIGKIRWNWRPQKTIIINGARTQSRSRSKDNITLVDGLHEGIVDADVWEKAQAIRQQANQNRLPVKKELKNPFAGLMFCSICGRTMTRRPSKNPLKSCLMCHKVGCETSSYDINEVENALLDGIRLLLSDYEFKAENKIAHTDNSDINKSQIKHIEFELAQLDKQKDNLYDLLEQQIYTNDIFLERSRKLSLRQKELTDELTKIRESVEPSISLKDTIIRFKTVLKEYPNASAEKKNELLKSIISKIIYNKPHASRFRPSELSLQIFPVIQSCYH